jgi:hypothetical protein
MIHVGFVAFAQMGINLAQHCHDASPGDQPAAGTGCGIAAAVVIAALQLRLLL